MIPIDTQPNTSQATETATEVLQNTIADSTTCGSSLITNNEPKDVVSLEAKIVNMDDEIQNDLSSAQQTETENFASTNSESNMAIQSTAAPVENSNQTFQSDAQQMPNEDDSNMMDGSHETEPYDNGCIPTATSSCISITENDNAVPKLNDTTQELNLEAFNSDLEEMDKLEFASSDSPASSDSGNITANTSCAITAENVSANQSEDICQTTHSLTDKQSLGDNSISELSITSTAHEMDAMTDSKDGQNMTTGNQPNHPEPSSTSHEPFVRTIENADINCTLELNSLTEVSRSNSSMLKVQTDISNASSEQAQENIVSTSNEGVVAEPSNDYNESAQSIHSMATCSTPARAVGNFNTPHNMNRSMPSVQMHLPKQLNMSAVALSIPAKCESPTAEIKPLEQESTIQVSTSKHIIQSPAQNNKNEMIAQTVVKDTAFATPENRNRTIRVTDSFTPKELDISFAKKTSPTLATAETSETIEPTQSDDDITVQQQSHEIVSSTDESQSKLKKPTNLKQILQFLCVKTYIFIFD